MCLACGPLMAAHSKLVPLNLLGVLVVSFDAHIFNRFTVCTPMIFPRDSQIHLHVYMDIIVLLDIVFHLYLGHINNFGFSQSQCLLTFTLI